MERRERDKNRGGLILVILICLISLAGCIFYIVRMPRDMPLMEVVVVGDNNEIWVHEQGHYDFVVEVDNISWVNETGETFIVYISHYAYVVVREVEEENTPLPTIVEFRSIWE